MYGCFYSFVWNFYIFEVKKVEDDEMIHHATPESELVERIKNGDERAFKEIFYRYKDKLFSYCCRFTKSETMAEEIVQDVLLKIWTTRERLNPELSFSNYLYTITRNYSLNFLKKAASDAALRNRLFYHFDETRCEPEETLIYNDLNRIAQKAIALLPPRRRQIYEMSRDNSLNYEDIANQLGVSKNTVRNQLVQARKFIRNYLNSNAELGLCLALILWNLL